MKKHKFQRILAGAAMALLLGTGTAWGEEGNVLGEIYDEAFPEAGWYYPQEVQFFSGLAEGGAGALALYSAGTRANRQLLAEAAFEGARAEMERQNPQLEALLDERDHTRLEFEKMQNRIAEIDDYIANGKQVYSHTTYVTVGKSQVPITHYRTVYPTPEEKADLLTERSSFQSALPEAEEKMKAAKLAAKPAEQDLDRRAQTFIERVRNGRVHTDTGRHIRRRYTRSLIMKRGLGALGLYGVIEAPVRVINAVNDRESGVSPVLRFGGAVKDRVISAIATDEAAADQLRAGSGE